MPPTLSKSDFKLARTCITKLYYRELGYPQTTDEDRYLEMLAEGGYMVEQIAKTMFADGNAVEYDRADPVVSWERTRGHDQVVSCMPKKPRDPTRLGGRKKKPKQDPHSHVVRELSGRHPRLALLCELTHPLERKVPDGRPLSHLVVRTIVSQLVSVAAARTIMGRLLEAHGDMEGVIAWAMRTKEDAPPSHGLSRAKRKAVAHWGRFIAERGDPREAWSCLGADDLVAEIMKMRGLGRWSAHMVAIFGFGHPGIWPDGDAGVVRAARVVFKGMRPPTVRRLIEGHESHVALCCWALLDQNRLARFEAGG